ncbi:MAG: PH domain-containing protein [Clostridia bacterium]|nr:PH domain-containing protein [Clostridia bacterium]
MRTFKYEFSKLIKALIIIGIILCVAGFVLVFVQVFRTIYGSLPVPSTYEIIGQVIMFFVTIFLGILLVWLLVGSSYTVDKEYIITKFGFIKSKFKIADIVMIRVDRNTDRLSVQFNNDTYMIIVVNSFWHDDFVNAVMAANRNIQYVIESKEGPTKKSDS